jgi:cell division protein FtsB
VKRAAPLLVTLVVVAMLFLAVFPTRTWIAQRRERAAVVHDIAELRAQNRQLSDRAGRLRSDAEIERLARERYNLVRPGERAFAILPPRERGRAHAKPKASEKRPWWQRAWDRLTPF